METPTFEPPAVVVVEDASSLLLSAAEDSVVEAAEESVDAVELALEPQPASIADTIVAERITVKTFFFIILLH